MDNENNQQNVTCEARKFAPTIDHETTPQRRKLKRKHRLISGPAVIQHALPLSQRGQQHPRNETKQEQNSSDRAKIKKKEAGRHLSHLFFSAWELNPLSPLSHERAEKSNKWLLIKIRRSARESGVRAEFCLFLLYIHEPCLSKQTVQ
ncbi:hypothetical protein TNCV_972121 [Trichonephila clavipes]|nr:hypothetical protein TNCV_972121 [Trichonephila clavipes]